MVIRGSYGLSHNEVEVEPAAIKFHYVKITIQMWVPFANVLQAKNSFFPLTLWGLVYAKKINNGKGKSTQGKQL